MKMDTGDQHTKKSEDESVKPVLVRFMHYGEKKGHAYNADNRQNLQTAKDGDVASKREKARQYSPMYMTGRYYNSMKKVKERKK